MSYIDIFGTLKDASFGGWNLSFFDYYIYDVVKPLMPKQDMTLFDRPGRPGREMISKKFTEYYLILKGYIKTTDYSTLKARIAALSAYLYFDTDQQLIISDENDRYWNCQYLDYEEVGERDDYTLINLVFTCTNPFAYDTTASTDTQAGITTDDTTFNITNGGHYYAYPVITITFNQAQTHIYYQNNNIPGNRFDVTRTFVANDVLEIDCWNGTVKLNGSADYTGFGSGGLSKAEWIMLAVGSNELQVGTDDDSIDIDVETAFSKIYFS